MPAPTTATFSCFCGCAIGVALASLTQQCLWRISEVGGLEFGARIDVINPSSTLPLVLREDLQAYQSYNMHLRQSAGMGWDFIRLMCRTEPVSSWVAVAITWIHTVKALYIFLNRYEYARSS